MIIALIPIVLILLYLYISSFSARTKTYYIPDVDLYVKTILTPKDKFGYILFGNNSDILLSDSVDYISVYYNISNSVIINSNKKDTIWYYNQIAYNKLQENEYTILSRAKEIHFRDYVIVDGVNETDTVFFQKRYMTNPIIIKKPYMEISVGERFDGIWIKNAGDSVYTKIEPIK